MVGALADCYHSCHTNALQDHHQPAAIRAAPACGDVSVPPLHPSHDLPLHHHARDRNQQWSVEYTDAEHPTKSKYPLHPAERIQP